LTIHLRTRLLVLLGCRLASLDLDGAVLGECHDRPYRGDDRCEHGADDADGERELGDRAPLVLHDHAPHVPFVNEILDLFDDLFAFSLERFPVGLLGHRCALRMDAARGRAVCKRTSSVKRLSLRVRRILVFFASFVVLDARIRLDIDRICDRY